MCTLIDITGYRAVMTTVGRSSEGKPADADLLIRVVSSQLEPEEIDQAALRLRAEIWDAGVEGVSSIAETSAPPGSKPGEAFAIGTLVVALSPLVVESVMQIVASWLGRQAREIEVEIDGQRLKAPVTGEQRDQLVAAYIARVKRRS